MEDQLLGLPRQPDNHTLFNVRDADIVSGIVFTIAFVGFVVNTIVGYFTAKLPTMNNPFGRLSASQATGEAVLCAVFCFYFAPMIYLDNNWMKQNSKHAGWINLICYDICIWSHLFIALNRLVAICFPEHCDTIFNRQNTKIMIFISWVIPVCTAVLFYKMHECDFYYSPKFWAFVFSENEVCNFISWKIDFYKDISIVAIIACMDTVTIINVHRLHSLGFGTSHIQRARRLREINFLKQAVLQGLVFVVELLTYFVFAWKFENKWAIWALTTLAWVSVHTADGLIIITYNREFRGLVMRPFRKLYRVTPIEATSMSRSTAVPHIHVETLSDRPIVW